ncbi:hypothetical protein BS78_09G018600 [Paspalum vaginatum]|nr:hypothetical protein BS78_09G018600 [Paspalum vaginatum]
MPPLHSILLGGLLLISSLNTPPCSAATANGDTLVGSEALAIGDKLISRNGKFALGFFQPGSGISKSVHNTTTPGWYLGIWFNRIPVFTVVWVGNREKPISDPNINVTHLKISRDGNLAILNNDTKSIIWSTHILVKNWTGTNITNTSAILSNDGNLAIIALTTQQMLWQSFDYPTNVMLPGAKFGRNKVTGFYHQAITTKSLVDPGPGSYSIQLDPNGVVLLRRHKAPSVVYWSWSSGNSSPDTLLTILKEVLDLDPRTRGLINPEYVENNEEEYYTYTSPDKSSSIFALIDITGQLKLMVWSQATQSWQSSYAQPADPCTPYATCGPFTVCNGNARPFCDCMVSFSQKSLLDWELGDRTGGCVRNTPLDCTRKNNMTSSTDMFHPIVHVVVPHDPQSIAGASTQSECEETCLNDCSCTAYSYNNSRCAVWHGDLLHVNKNDGIDNNSEDVVYIRLAANGLQSFGVNNKRKPTLGVIVTTASILSCLILMLMISLFIWRNKFNRCVVPLQDSQGSAGITTFRYTDLSRATKNFSQMLGGGGFGSVYKGVLSDSTAVAVKRLHGARQEDKQFRAEVSSIGLIQHINLVKLIGFCCERDKRLLVYEHMSNGSLETHLFKRNPTVLNWSIRYQIIVGVARGLSYLHQSCRECIIHCDIKPENILLDASFAPKIADFGMAAFVGRDFSRILTTFRGTVGYLAPEWLSGVAVTPKVDVYSFGMVLMEIISGRRNSPEEYTSNSYHVAYFPVQAISKLHKGDVRSLVDPQLNGCFDLEEAERACKVACWCIQDNEFERPTMGEVVRVLEGLQELNMPPMPRLLAAITDHSDESSNS